MRSLERVNIRTNERTYVRTYSHTYVRDRPYSPSTTLLCEGIIIYQVYQSACNIKFIKSAHLEHGIYKPREVEHPKKKLVRTRTRLSDVQPPSVYKSHILNGPINKLYITLTLP